MMLIIQGFTQLVKYLPERLLAVLESVPADLEHMLFAVALEALPTDTMCRDKGTQALRANEVR